jgi:hypothetical protein
MVERKHKNFAGELNRKGNKLGLRNQPTSSRLQTERYAFLWKTSKLKKLEGLAGKRFHLEIDRALLNIITNNLQWLTFTQ